jgi:hypothetical protein
MLTLSPIRNFTADWSSGNLNPPVIIRTHEDSCSGSDRYQSDQSFSSHIYKYRRLAHKGDPVRGRWKSEIGPVEYVEPMLALSPWKSKPVGHYPKPRGFYSD